MTLDSVVFLDYDEMIIWKIPDLKPLTQQPSVVIEQVVDHRIFSSSSLLGGGVSGVVIDFCGRLSDWYWNKQQVVLGIRSVTSEPYTILRFKPSSHFWPSASTGRLLCKKTVFSLPQNTPNPASIYRLCEDSLIACFPLTGRDLIVSISGEEPESVVHLIMRLQHPMNRVREFSFCPLSGRMCYITNVNELEIADLFTSIE